jgi:hypothetical protein
MDKHFLWKLISNINLSALNEGDENAALEPLVNALTSLDIPSLEAFQELLSKYLYDIDGEKYANNAGVSGESGDAFLYCRCYVVANGETFYNTVKDDPKKMPKTSEEWCEGLLFVTGNAWENKTGKDFTEWNFFPSVDYESGSNKENWS